jgi:hypothetical protein
MENTQDVVQSLFPSNFDTITHIYITFTADLDILEI